MQYCVNFNIARSLSFEIIVVDALDLHGIKGRNIEDLSGGELQRFAIAIVCIQRADV